MSCQIYHTCRIDSSKEERAPIPSYMRVCPHICSAAKGASLLNAPSYSDEKLLVRSLPSRTGAFVVSYMSFQTLICSRFLMYDAKSATCSSYMQIWAMLILATKGRLRVKWHRSGVRLWDGGGVCAVALGCGRWQPRT